jgi:hypothetical protein
MRTLNFFIACAICGLLVFCEPAPMAVDDAAETADVTLAKNDNNKGAVRWIPDDFCGVYDWEGDVVWTPCHNQIATYSGNGNAIVTVKATGVANPTGEVIVWDAYNPPQWLSDAFLEYYGFNDPPLPCAVLDPMGEYLFTLNWWNKLTPSGEATMICHYQKKWEYMWPE